MPVEYIDVTEITNLSRTALRISVAAVSEAESLQQVTRLSRLAQSLVILPRRSVVVETSRLNASHIIGLEKRSSIRSQVYGVVANPGFTSGFSQGFR